MLPRFCDLDISAMVEIYGIEAEQLNILIRLALFAYFSSFSSTTTVEELCAVPKAFVDGVPAVINSSSISRFKSRMY